MNCIGARLQKLAPHYPHNCLRTTRRPQATCKAIFARESLTQDFLSPISAVPEVLQHLKAGLPACAAGSGQIPPLLAALRGICFDDACQNELDQAFLIAITIPTVTLAAAVAYWMRPPPQDKLESGQIFEDSSTGTVFEAPEGRQPERDRLGELAFRAISYTPWPLEAGAAGDRIRIDVGLPGRKQPRTFVFEKLLRQPSQLVVVQLPRPLGIVFEEDARRKRAVVAGFVPGGHAEQLVRRTRLDPGLAARAPREGDVLRACTCTNIVYQTGALLFGAQKPERSVVLYGADGQTWPAVMTALQKGLVADGEVTLVLERAVPARE